MEMDPHEGNGRATIREVHTLLTETRHETESMLKNMEERVIHSVNASEVRILAALGDLGTRVSALEAWRHEQEQARAVSSATREARTFFFRSSMDWLEVHWKFVAAVAAVVFTIVAVVADIRIMTK